MFFTKKNFSKYNIIEPENLISFQRESYERFLSEGLRKVFLESFPIFDYSEKEIKLDFVDVSIGHPKFSEEECFRKNLTYSVPVRVTLRLTNLITNQSTEQEIYFGDIPYMTERGTFIINGIERLIVNQILRAPGVYFNMELFGERRLFGAKILPERGAWLEFQIEPSNILSVKIDRKKKVAGTVVLKAFGISNEEIEDLFKEDDKDLNILKNTLKKDETKDFEEALLLIHAKLKSYEPNTFDNALQFFEGTFKRLDRYSLGEIGRYIINRRLNLESNSLLIEKEDLISIIKEILRLQKDKNAEPDDIDALWNRHVRGVGEFLKLQTRLGLTRFSKFVKDKISTFKKEEIISPSQIIYPKIFINTILELFNVHPLSQIVTQINILSELEHKRRLSATGPGGLTRERAGLEVRDVHESHYGKICPIQTPEGQNIGLIVYQALYSKIDEYGFLQTPYYKVEKGKVLMDKIIYLNAYEERKYKIGSGNVRLDKNGKILDEFVEGRKYGKPTILNKDEIEFIDISPIQPFSVSTNLIPFLTNDDANRTQMGSNMQKQAVPLLKPQIPIVSTGLEEYVARDSGYLIYAEEDGEVLEADGEHVTVLYKKKNKKEKKIYILKKYQRTNDFTVINQKPVVKPGDKFKKGDLLVDGPGTKNGVLALGANLLVAFLNWRGYTFEDSIVISERVLKEDIFTSVSLEEFSIDVRDTKLGKEEVTNDIPGVPEAKLRNLDEEGIIRIGASVKAGDILVGKITPRKEVELTPEEKLLKAIFGEKVEEVKDSSLYLEPGKYGKVARVKILDRAKGEISETGVLKRISVEIAKLKKLQIGDKLANRHGNKGVISIILKEEDMPFLEDGRPVDVVLSSLGVVSRMNLGQIFEMHLGYAAYKLGYRAIVPSVSGVTDEDIREELRKANLPEDGKLVLYDGRTGEPFKNKIAVGIMYLMKLVHMAEDKAHARAIGPYSLITQQPLGGRSQFGGQRFGEMEVWALEGYSAVNTLQEMLTIKSDDVVGRGKTYTNIIKGEPIKTPSIPSSFNLLVKELQSLGFSIEIKYREEKERKEEELIKEPELAPIKEEK
ncbi:MAG: DNA-directed RNA polymerase subunit beta [Minisyncoccia bacterium]